MHYYSFNIEHYTSHTARLSILEDIAYRRLLDLYYLSERPLDGCASDVARDIGMREHADEVSYVLNKYFTLTVNLKWTNKRADIEIQFYQKQKKTAIKAGKASAKARQAKASEQVSNDRSTTVQPISNHESVISNQQSLNTNNKIPLKEKTLVEKPDDSEFESLWILYGKKGNRKTSLQKFNRLNKTNLALLKNHLPKYVQSTPDLQYRKGLQSYIEKECWNDEITTTGNYYETAKNNHARPESNLARFSRKIQADIAAEDPFE
jgi:uncharacterized protein YdaU (DUF1376 family)